MGRGTVYNNITSEESYKNVNEDNKQLLEDFIEYLQSTDKAKTTISQYVADLKIMFTWSLENNKNKFFVDFNKRDVMKYQNYLINTLQVSSARVRRLRATCSSLSNFIENILDLEHPNFRNIINKIPAPSSEKVREKSVFEEEDLQKLLDYLISKGKYQQCCAIALAMSNGSRKSELTRFKVDYFDESNIVHGSLYKTPEKITTKGRGSKGKLLFKYTLVQSFKPYFDLWMEERKKLGIESEWLLVSKKDEEWIQMPVSTLDSWAETFSKFLKLPFYFHSLRHYFCTTLSKQQIPDNVIKEINGWSSIDMVNIYKDIEAEDEFGKYFDEEGIKKVEEKGLGNL